MEESKPAENTPTHLPNPPPDTTQPQAPPPPALPPQSKKRPLENNVQIQDSKYFKMRLVVKDVRPHFLEMLSLKPMFRVVRSCQANPSIPENLLQLKAYGSLNKLSVAFKDRQDDVLRTPDFRNCKASSEIQEQIKIVMEIYKQMTSEKLSITQSLQPDVKAAGQQFQSDVVTEKQQPQDGGGGGETHKSHIVGGSAFGWNFITFSSTEPLYYGVTKESFRTSQTVQEQQDK